MKSSVQKYIDENFPKTVRYNTTDDGTLIGLPFKYTVPCASGMFQEIYYWDTYFTNVGLLVLGNTELAKNNTDNMLYLVNKYGFMPNGNRTGYLDRSQPPFLSFMVKDVFAATSDLEWLESAYNTLKIEYDFWQTKKILENGLNAYTNYKIDYDDLDFQVSYAQTRMGYRPAELTPQIKEQIYQAIKSFCESGWDCNSRFMEKPHEFSAIDLNCLLYGMENNMLFFSELLKNGEECIWQQRVSARKEKMQTLWCEEKGIFTDYNPSTNEYSNYVSAASLYPMFVGLATKEQAAKTVKQLKKLEFEYGVSAGEANPPWDCCQWDYPHIWPPMQFIAYKALAGYGYIEDAERIAKKYVRLIEENFEKTGNLWEKYDCITGATPNTDYDAPKMLGWTFGVYTYFCNELNI
ncbi:MAG: alpha,alpha-trehalase [Clostridia bacterium]|nr:alpha,alpha-trehalase [Clostridia bacterium]